MKIEVSYGEIVDKYSILWIKSRRIKDEEKLKNIKLELMELNSIMCSIPYWSNGGGRFKKLVQDLDDVNEKLWDIEDKLREKESKKEFDQEFIELARSVYFTNDSRAKIKKEINILTKSGFIEEKSYAPYNESSNNS